MNLDTKDSFLTLSREEAIALISNLAEAVNHADKYKEKAFALPCIFDGNKAGKFLFYISENQQ
jgi:hypothetical protein